MEYVYLQALILPCSSASVCEFILLNGRGTTTGIPEYGALMGLKTYFGNCSTNILFRRSSQKRFTRPAGTDVRLHGRRDACASHRKNGRSSCSGRLR